MNGIESLMQENGLF